ncbi:hypothetical protein QAD02_001645 [Eretmocerus hayati]|uniref:Uncharacterized protein n=1 Tax=Eretmocerus hayati TaxID=131215 RepID=A0ACC2NH25_9HYME|nr:hypothetical protein QAD02_001645 [Eretmocerus hayati]
MSATKNNIHGDGLGCFKTDSDPGRSCIRYQFEKLYPRDSFACCHNINLLLGRREDHYCFISVKGYRLNIVRQLIEAGSDVSIKGRHGRTFLHSAAAADNIDVLEELLKKSRQHPIIDLPNYMGLTLLIIAVERNNGFIKLSNQSNLSYAMTIAIGLVFYNGRGAHGLNVLRQESALWSIQ